MTEITAATPARTSGYLEDRLSGLSELLQFAADSAILDAGTNRGLVALEFARRGATLVHGCDLYGPGIEIAREIFKEVDVSARFEVVDLSCGPSALEAAFAAEYRPHYDIVLFLGVYQHLRKQMPLQELQQLVQHLASKTARFFACRDHAIRRARGGTRANRAGEGSLLANQPRLRPVRHLGTNGLDLAAIPVGLERFGIALSLDVPARHRRNQAIPILHAAEDLLAVAKVGTTEITQVSADHASAHLETLRVVCVGGSQYLAVAFRKLAARFRGSHPIERSIRGYCCRRSFVDNHPGKPGHRTQGRGW